MYRLLTILMTASIVFACEKERAIYDDPFDRVGPGEACGGLVFCEDGLVCRDGFCIATTDTDTGTADIDKPPLPDQDEPTDTTDPSGAADEAEERTDADWIGLCDGTAVVDEQSLPHFAACDTIAGDLVIERTLLPAVEQLHNIERIEGSLIIKRNVLLNDLSGLRSLQTIGGGLSVESNAKLYTLGDLLSLHTIDGTLLVKDNARLSKLDLVSLQIAGSVWLERNRLLGGLGLPVLQSVSGAFFLFDNDLLSTLGGLSALQALGELYLQDNDGLIQISAAPLPFIYLSRLTVRGNRSLRSFSGLEGLMAVGELSVYDDPALVSFKGLGALEQANGTVSVEQCGIKSFAGLERLIRIGGDLIIRQCDELVHPDGPPQLQTIEGFLVLHRNAKLEDLSGFPSLRSVGGLSLINNALLDNLAGLAFLSWIYGPAEIQNNPLLTDLSGLDHLRSVSDRFVLLNNPLLSDTAALLLLEQVGGDMAVSYNDSLNEFSFPALVWIGGDLYVEENPLLPQCAAEELRDTLTDGYGWTGSATIQGNDATAQCPQ